MGLSYAQLGTASVVVIAITSTAGAEMLGLELLDSPDILSSFVDVDYDAASDQLTAAGFALQIRHDGDVLTDFDAIGGWGLAADITDTGEIGFGGGGLAIGGEVLGGGPDLLTAELVSFGFADTGGDLFEFVFTVTGGDLQSMYGGPGALVGVILDANFGGTGFTGSFGQDFDNNGGVPGFGGGVADTAPLIPAPATLAVLLLGGRLMGRGRRRGR